MKVWKLPDQVVRLVILITIALVALVIVRQRFVPESFGELGHYRADAVGLVASSEVHFAGMQACIECHDDVATVKAGSYHRGLTCEGCHGPAADHVDNPTENFPDIPTGRTLCVRCHSYLSSRPTGFPQIIETIHNPMEPCTSCHEPHDPTPPEVPESCSACHAEIARSKAVSHHWSLKCETCHMAVPEHKENPRSYLPKKPMKRAFCGKCHGKAADVASSIPRIDIVEHGARYLCWQCHYPHFPEGR